MHGQKDLAPRVTSAVWLIGAIASVTVGPHAAETEEARLSSTGDRLGPAVWTLTGVQDGENLGRSVASAGDVNGDGYSDVVVAAPLFDSELGGTGRVAVYHGSKDGVDIAAAWSQEGGSQLGFSVNTAGDVNGDGYADLIVGALDAGAQVFHGSPCGLSPSPDWTGGSAARAVACAGDVNGDGYSDVIIGEPGASDSAGFVAVFHGSSAGLSDVADWSIASGSYDVSAGDQLGFSVACAGDVNGDGYSDVIIGSPTYSVSGWVLGRVLVFFGSVAGVTGPPWIRESWVETSYDPLLVADGGYGSSVAGVGDVNGDGYADVIVGAPDMGLSGGFLDGLAFLYEGDPSGVDEVTAWTERGDWNNLGSSVGSAGDVDGDGFADLVLGAPGYGAGIARVYRGDASGPHPPWSTYAGGQTDAAFGSAVASAGDVNGDGYSDVIVGAPLHDGSGVDDGQVQVFHGGPLLPRSDDAWSWQTGQTGGGIGLRVAPAGDIDGDGFGDVILGAHAFDDGELDEGRALLFRGTWAGLAPLPSWTADGDQVEAYLGSDIAGAGDVNGDGYADVIVGALGYDGAEADVGRAYVFHGSPEGLSTTPDWTAEGDQVDAAFGVGVSSAGDVNGDGHDDVIVGAYLHDGAHVDGGRALVYLGSSSGLESTASWIVEGGQANARLGYRVAGAGDVNGDGFDDVLVGAYTHTGDFPEEGAAFLYLGSASGLSTTSAWSAEGDQAYAWYSRALASAGDVNGDGLSDVIVGAFRYNDAYTDDGRAYVYLGTPTGLETEPVWTTSGDATEDRLGDSVDGIGDINGDGFADIAVGTRDDDSYATNGGSVQIHLGSPGGPESAAVWLRSGTQVGEELGTHLAGVGDVDGDGFADLVASAPYRDGTYVDEGRALLFPGNYGPGRDLGLRQLRTDGVTPIPPGSPSDSDTEFHLHATLPSFVGRTVLQIEVEVKPHGLPLDGTGTWLGDVVDTGTAGQATFAVVVSGLASSTPHHWRVRCHFDPTRPPFQGHGPWRHIPDGGWEEADLRTAPSMLDVADADRHHPTILRAIRSPTRLPVRVRYVLPHRGGVQLTVHDVAGRHLADLRVAQQEGGPHTVRWDGFDDSGRRVAPGLYFMRMAFDHGSECRRFVVIE